MITNMSSRTSLQNSPPNFKDTILTKSIKLEKTLTDDDKTDLSTDKLEPVSTSSYKFLSWREKDRRRRFRDEWKHMWLVIPHGNFEVMCLVCHKVMTQRKLDTIKRHTVRRHTEILDMNQGERIVLFEKLLLEHNSVIFPPRNGHGQIDTIVENGGKPDSEVIDLEKLLSSDCVSATSSSSLSPSDSRQSNGEMNFFSKRGKYSRKNTKMNSKSNLKIDSIKPFSLKVAMSNKSSMNRNQSKSNTKAPPSGDNKPFNIWSTKNCAERLLPHSNSNPLHESMFNKFNGPSCPNSYLPPMPVMNKCPLCLEDCSQNGTDTNNAFSRILNHIQQKHSDKLSSSVPSFDSNLFGSTTANDLVKLQSLLLPPTATTNYMSISNAVSSANLISLLYYQELMRQNVPIKNSSPQYAPVTSDPVYYQPVSVSSNSSMFPLFTSPSSQCPLRPSSSIPPAFILSAISEPARLERSDSISNTFDDTSSNFDKFSPFKRAKFSAESFISEANKQSAFYNPKQIRIEEKDVLFHPITSLSVGLSSYLSSTESPNSRCKANNKIKEESQASDASKMDTSSSYRKSLLDPNVERNLMPKSSAQGNLTCHALRFGPGQDLKGGLVEYARRKNISAAFIVTCCGSLQSAKLRMANSEIPNTALEIKSFNKHFEIVSLVGSISDDGCHIHISLSDCNGDVVGGHVVGDLIVHTTAEVMLGQICGVRMHREMDETTGHHELSFTTFDGL